MSLFLGVETSCDETAAAVVEVRGEGHDAPVVVRSSAISSQVALHSQYGGVVPHLAGLAHAENIQSVVEQAMGQAGVGWDALTAVAVTSGPGLAPALRVGVRYAVEQCQQRCLPLIPVNHLEGHIASLWLADVGQCIDTVGGAQRAAPLRATSILILIVSGGHTELVLMRRWGDYELLGHTLDDAAGEAFDKVAKMLGLGYPGGPAVSQRAAQGNAAAFDFPRPMMRSGDFMFSFAGLKTAVLYKLKGQNLENEKLKIKNEKMYEGKLIDNISASFQQAAVDVLVSKTLQAIELHHPAGVGLVGGVAANALLRETLRQRCQEFGLPFYAPLLKWTGDNGAMIALAGSHQYLAAPDKGIFLKTAGTLDFKSDWGVEEVRY